MHVVRVNEQLCDGCGQCVQICPVECIHIEDGKAIVGPECILCFACVAHCPQEAIIEPQLPRMRRAAPRPRVMRLQIPAPRPGHTSGRQPS